MDHTQNHGMASGSMGETGQSVVASCDVTMCTFNQQHQCHAGSIQVAFVEGMAHCATFTPREGAMGVGSSETERQMDSSRASGTNDQSMGA